MANKLTAIITADASRFNRVMKGLGSTASSAASMARVAIATIGAATVALGFAAVKTAAKYEMLEKRLQGIFGKDQGSKIFQQVIKAAQQSSLETDKLAESYIRFSALMGEEPDSIKVIESIGFAAKVLGKDIKLVTESFAKMFNRLKRGELVDKRLRDRLMGAFGLEGNQFFEDIKNGLVTSDQAMAKLKERGEELRKVFETGIGASVSKLAGSWDKFLIALGQGQNLKSTEKIVDNIRKILDDLAKSDAVKELADEFNKFLENLKPEDIKELFSDALGLMTLMAKTMTIMVDHWKTILTIVIAYKGIMLAIAALGAVNTFAAKGAVQSAATSIGSTGIPRGIAKATGVLALGAATAYVGFKLGNIIGKEIAEWMYPDDAKIFAGASTKAEIAEFREKSNREKKFYEEATPAQAKLNKNLPDN